MKKIILGILILVITASAVFTQDIFDPRLLTQVGLSAEEIEKIQEIQIISEKKIQEANVEMNVLKAQLEKLLFDEHPDMNQVRKTIESTLKWRIQTEMAKVEARVQIRENMGSEKWDKLLRLRKKIQQRIQNQVVPNAGTGQNNNTGNVRTRN